MRMKQGGKAGKVPPKLHKAMCALLETDGLTVGWFIERTGWDTTTCLLTLERLNAAPIPEQHGLRRWKYKPGYGRHGRL